MRIAINGFGRIGRCLVRAGLKNGFFDKNELVAVNDLSDAKDMAYLLKYDSVHRTLEEKITVKNDAITVGKTTFATLCQRDALQLPWSKHEVDLVIDATGVMKDKVDCLKHLTAGARKVLVTSPLDNADSVIVPGVNEEKLDKSHSVVSMASCTTNALAPVAKILDAAYGIESGFLCTTHAYTNDQKLLDQDHKDYARGRSAALSIIPSTTGAAKAIGKVLPALQGKLDGIALRVPVPDGSINGLVVQVKKAASKDEINALLKKKAEGEFKKIMAYNEEPIVSSDIIGRSESSIVDSLRTMSIKNTMQVYSWYVNEWGYVNRLCDLGQMMK